VERRCEGRCEGRFAFRCECRCEDMCNSRGEHRPFEWGRRVGGGLSSALGVVRCGRSAGCVLCVLWAISAAVWGGVPCGVSISSSLDKRPTKRSSYQAVQHSVVGGLSLSGCSQNVLTI